MAAIGLKVDGLAAAPIAGNGGLATREPGGAVIVVTVVTTVVVTPVRGSVPVIVDVVVETEGDARAVAGSPRRRGFPANNLVGRRHHASALRGRRLRAPRRKPVLLPSVKAQTTDRTKYARQSFRPLMTHTQRG
jgi:hypothetical protein